MAPSPRPPAVAGQFYAGTGQALAHQVEACFLDARGPGALPPRQRSSARTVIAGVVPHAGYQYSGAIAARVYWEVAAGAAPSTVLILGVDHHGAGAPAALSDRAWLTPLGPTGVDHELVERLTRGPVVVDEEAHAMEHSIEVQLPFLEYVLPKPRFVALQVRFGPFDFLEKVAHVVREAIRGRDVLLLASTDFSHYVPAGTAKRLDRMAIDPILANDPAGLYETVVRNDISMCGIAPTTTLLQAIHGDGLVPELLRWGHSGEVETMPDVVGYAAIVFRPRSAAAAERPSPARSSSVK